MTIPSFSFKDETPGVTLDVILCCPNGEHNLLMHSENNETISYLNQEYYSSDFYVSNNSFRVTQKGQYILRFFALDSFGNVGQIDYMFVVE